MVVVEDFYVQLEPHSQLNNAIADGKKRYVLLSTSIANNFFKYIQGG